MESDSSDVPVRRKKEKKRVLVESESSAESDEEEVRSRASRGSRTSKGRARKSDADDSIHSSPRKKAKRQSGGSVSSTTERANTTRPPEEDEDEEEEGDGEGGSQEISDDPFVIPTRDDDLLMATEGSYTVRQLVDDHVIAADMDLYEDEMRDGEWSALLRRFDSFFSLVRANSTNTPSPDLRRRMIDAIIQGYEQMKPTLSDVLVDVASGSPSRWSRSKCRELSDVLLMSIYLLNKNVHFFEKEANNRVKKKATIKKGPKKTKKKAADTTDPAMDFSDHEELPNEDSTDHSWYEMRIQIVHMFINIINYTVSDKDRKTREGAVRYLWSGGEVNKGMIRTFLDTAFTFFETVEITRHASRQWLVTIFRLIRSICTTFSFFTHVGGLLFEKLMSLEYYRESATSYPFIETIQLVSNKNDMDQLLISMLKYFQNTNFVVNQSNSKGLCLFMTSMAERAPFQVLFHIAPFITLLSDENAAVRSSALSVLAYLLDSKYFDPNAPLTPRLHNARKRMLEKIQQHMKDINANVRCAAIKCFNSLLVKHRLPTEVFTDGIVSLIGTRLLDQKVAVRKEAVKFCSAFLQHNPYGHDLSYAVNAKKLMDLLKKRDQLVEQNKEYSQIQQCEMLFDNSAEAFAVYLENYLQMVIDGEGTLKEFNDQDIAAMTENVTSGLDTMWKQARDAEVAEGRMTREEAAKLQPVTIDGINEPSDTEQYRTAFTCTFMKNVEKAAEIYVRALVVDNIKNDAFSVKKLLNVGAKKMARDVLPYAQACFLEVTARLAAISARASLRAQYDKEMSDKLLERYNKDIKNLMDKMVIEKEVAKVIPVILNGIFQGDYGDSKIGIQFIIESKEFEITGSEHAVRRLCAMVWKSDDESRQMILAAARSMFMSHHADPHLRNVSTAHNIMKLVQEMNELERASMEEVLSLTASSHPFPEGVFTTLWEILDNKEFEAQHANAIKALSLLCRADLKRMRSWLRRFQKLIREGRPDVATHALYIISTLGSPPRENKDRSPAYRIPASDSLFITIERFVIAEVMREKSKTWHRCVIATLDIFFDVCKDTCLVSTRLVARLVWAALRLLRSLMYYGSHEMHEEDEKEWSTVQDRHKYVESLWCKLMERICAIVGDMAVKFLVHSDVTFVREMLRLREQMLAEDGPAPLDVSDRALRDWEIRSALQKGIFDWVDPDQQNITGYNEEERIRNRSQAISEIRLIRPHRLLGRLFPLVVHCCRSRNTPSNIRNAAVTALAKFMLVSPAVASKAARTFFAMLNNSPDPVLRNNLVVACADLTFRHPNLVEKYAGCLYSELHDPSSCVRETCMLILTHLIGRDLLKTHPPLAYALLGYVDPEPSIQSITNTLFTEWTKKDGVFSHVSEFITRLAQDGREVPYENFKIIMTHFLGLVKEKKDSNHIQSLIEKLCKRFEFCKVKRRLALNENMPAYFSFCLSLLPLNVRSFHKMVDNVDHFREFLHDDRVHEDFMKILTAFLKEDKSQNPDLTNEVQSFIRQIENFHISGKSEKEVEEAATRFGVADAAALKRLARAKKERAGSQAPPHSPVKKQTTPLKSPRPQRKRVRRVAAHSSDSDEEE